MKMKSVLNKHRENSRKFIEHSNIIVKSNLAKNILRTAIAVIRTERPVYVQKSLNEAIYTPGLLESIERARRGTCVCTKVFHIHPFTYSQIWQLTLLRDYVN